MALGELGLPGDKADLTGRRKWKDEIGSTAPGIYPAPIPGFDQSPTWQAPEILLDDGRTLVLDYT